jgi:hypothetical protein
MVKAVVMGVPALSTKAPYIGPSPNTTRKTSRAGSYAVSVPRTVVPGVNPATVEPTRESVSVETMPCVR